MKTKFTKKRLLAALLALCMVLALVPISAFAGEIDFLPQGVTYSMDNKHTYHTQVNVTANVSVKAFDGTVIETKQVTKSSEEFLKGGVGTLQAKLAELQTEIETPYQSKGTITRENETQQSTILDHFETASFYTFTPISGDPVDFSTDLDTARQYFENNPDATGTFTELLDMHEYQKHNYTYDLIVQQTDQAESPITSATVENVKFNYQSGDAPRATAQVSEADADKYEIAYECWQQFENNQPVAVWYSDNGSHGSLPTITAFESGKSYVYSLMLEPKDGYSFSSETAITVNGQKVSAPFVGGSMYVPSIKTITMPTVSVIDVVEINGVTISFNDGDKPVFTGNVPDGADYAFRCEWWELDSKSGAMSTDFGNFYENKITVFEAEKTYHYGVYVTTIYGDRYVFGPDTKLKINGEFVNYTRYEGDESDGSDGTMWVITDLTMTPQASGAMPEYKIIEGANGRWTKNTDDTLTFRANGDFSKFKEVKVDGSVIAPENYTANAGSTVITLHADYLSTLSVGEHTLTVVYTDGECSTRFEIRAAQNNGGNNDPGDSDEPKADNKSQGRKSPNTGENGITWLAALFLIGGVSAGTAAAAKKKKRKI